jgi:hypothetical protein
MVFIEQAKAILPALIFDSIWDRVNGVSATEKQ